MKKQQKILLFVVISGCMLSGLMMTAAPKWRTAYYANQPPFSTKLPLNKVPWTKYTHVIQIGMHPTFKHGKPGLDSTSYRIDGNKAEFVRLAHKHGVKALVAVSVGPQIASIMEKVTSPAYIDKFVAILAAFINANNYDGIDIDWEGVSKMQDYRAHFPVFIKKLRAALPNKIITIAAGIYLRKSYEEIHDLVDQINIMCYDYDLSDYAGQPLKYSWYNGCVRKGKTPFGRTDTPKSQEAALWYYSKLNIPPAKIGIGVPFYGYVKQGLRANSSDGVTGPKQKYASGNAKNNTRKQISYNTLLNSVYWQKGIKKWDNIHKAPYVSYNPTGTTNDAFITYTNPRQVAETVKFIKENKFGGIMTFSLASEYRPTKKGDQRYPLSTAVENDIKAAFGNHNRHP